MFGKKTIIAIAPAIAKCYLEAVNGGSILQLLDYLAQFDYFHAWELQTNKNVVVVIMHSTYMQVFVCNLVQCFLVKNPLIP